MPTTTKLNATTIIPSHTGSRFLPRQPRRRGSRMSERKPARWKCDGRIGSERKDCAMFIVGRPGSHPTIFVEANIGDAHEQEWFNKQIALLKRRMCAPLVAEKETP